MISVVGSTRDGSGARSAGGSGVAPNRWGELSHAPFRPNQARAARADDLALATFARKDR
jgi:hypothetical protein